ncbi:Gfo/Idh/MocA family protein [Kribbella sp. CA-293567]|uniref:Gfo/Idh/MocA family protein n=1 Tax=Kribbella sp. CA-293567 TaxID=3002436 RepID=UPI0022DDB94C|nr:Gfo/Idh/MocA family oxidoreductase [Kribbella sp. CA-293567]WBQ06193.1 Gfo/Idh/MocA family oxidoreductase [Kribbella sp. CA-293567]
MGIHGHGASHVRQALRLADAGRCEFVAVADPRPPATDQLTRSSASAGTPAVHPDLPALLAAEQVDVVVLCTPIHTHATLAELALRAGADVLLEKPPVASIEEFDHLTEVLSETGRRCQVGFQAHGSGAVRALAGMVAEGALGEIRGIGVTGTWVRAQAYWQRAKWAGRRTLDGVPVVDGAVTNPFAHAVAAALLVDGSARADQIAQVETELFRANPIEADDTSTVRIRTTRGTSIVAAFTLCAAENSPPRVTVYGSRRSAVLRYTTDELVLGATTTQYGREELLDNLLDHRRDGVALLSPLESTGGFTRVLDAVRSASAPARIADELVRWEGSGDERHPVVPGVEKWIEQAAERQALFSELGTPWTS